MTNEELLKPRWKVIADYPNSPFVIGQIFVIPNFDKDFTKKYWADDKDKYPHLFKRLQWWEERKPDEMPKYVKSIMQEYTHGVKVGVVIMVKEWVRICDAMYAIQSRKEEYHASCFIPATAAEYEAYLQTLTVK